MLPANFIITDFQPAHQPAFRRLYQDWFISCFHQPIEPVDDFVLADPEKTILQKGGAILIASENAEVAGFVALKKTGASEMELTKMIVRPESRGKGLGEILCRAILERAATLGAASVILYSHSSLKAAVALYRKLGFQEVPLEQGLYSSFRCDMKMKKSLDAGMEPTTPTLYQWAGGENALQKLFRVFYDKVLKDDLIGPVFRNMSADHPRHVADFVSEVFGGPKKYTEADGGSHAIMVAHHVGKMLDEQKRKRWIQLLLDTADEIGLPTDPEFRSALVGYLEWGSRIAVLNSQSTENPVADSEPMPSWGWGVPGGPYQPKA